MRRYKALGGALVAMMFVGNQPFKAHACQQNTFCDDRDTPPEPWYPPSPAPAPSPPPPIGAPDPTVYDQTEYWLQPGYQPGPGPRSSFLFAPFENDSGGSTYSGGDRDASWDQNSYYNRDPDGSESMDWFNAFRAQFAMPELPNWYDHYYGDGSGLDPEWVETMEVALNGGRYGGGCRSSVPRRVGLWRQRATHDDTRGSLTPAYSTCARHSAISDRIG